VDFTFKRLGWFPAAARFTEAIAHTSNFPLAFAFGVFLALSGHMLSRRTWIRYATPLYANHFTCLVGASGITHKSTAMNLGLEAAGDHLDIPPLRSVTTRQGLLLAMMNGGGNAIVVLDELATLLTKPKRQDYAADLLTTLTELYGCPRTAGTYTRKDPITVDYCFLSLLAGSTIEWIQSSITANDLLAGFGNRMTWIVGSPRPENPWPGRPYWADFSWGTITDHSGEVLLDENARERWNEYYLRFQGRQRQAHNFHRTMAERIPEKILKNVLVQCAWYRTTICDDDILRRAIDWGDYLEASLEHLTPHLEDPERQVLAAIKEGRDTRPLLYAHLSAPLGGDRLRRALQNLRWLSLIKEVDGKLTATGRRGRMKKDVQEVT